MQPTNEMDPAVKDDDALYVLTEQECMRQALLDFGIEVTVKMAKGISEDFLELMMNAGHIVRKCDGD